MGEVEAEDLGAERRMQRTDVDRNGPQGASPPATAAASLARRRDGGDPLLAASGRAVYQGVVLSITRVEAARSLNTRI